MDAASTDRLFVLPASAAPAGTQDSTGAAEPGPPTTTREQGPGPPQADADTRRAIDHALRLLALRARTTSEVAGRLTGAGYAPEVIEAAIERLTELRLLDDGAFAREWIQERIRRKVVAAGALLQELADKGIDSDIADAAVEEAGLDEVSMATDFAAKHIERLSGLPVRRQAARLQGLLGRRGFSEETCEAAITAVLPPEGWD